MKNGKALLFTRLYFALGYQAIFAFSRANHWIKGQHCVSFSIAMHLVTLKTGGIMIVVSLSSINKHSAI